MYCQSSGSLGPRGSLKDDEDQRGWPLFGTFNNHCTAKGPWGGRLCIASNLSKG